MHILSLVGSHKKPRRVVRTRERDRLTKDAVDFAPALSALVFLSYNSSSNTRIVDILWLPRLRVTFRPDALL